MAPILLLFCDYSHILPYSRKNLKFPCKLNFSRIIFLCKLDISTENKMLHILLIGYTITTTSSHTIFMDIQHNKCVIISSGDEVVKDDFLGEYKLLQKRSAWTTKHHQSTAFLSNQTTMKMFLHTACIIGLCAFAIGANKLEKNISKETKDYYKRRIIDTGYRHGSDFDVYKPTNDHDHIHQTHHEQQVLSKTIIKEIAQPYPFEVEKHVPYPVKVEVPVDRPYPVHVPKPYPVHVDKPVSYEVKVNVPQPYTIYKQVLYEVKYPVDKPYTVHVLKPYTVYVEKRVPYEVVKHVPYPIKVFVNKPYTVHLPVDKHVPYTVEKPVPYPVKVPVDRPYPVTVEKHVPYLVDKSVPYTVERPVPYPVKVPVKVEVPVPYKENEHEEKYYPETEYKGEHPQYSNEQNEHNIDAWGATGHWTSSVHATAATTKAKRINQRTSVDYSLLLATFVVGLCAFALATETQDEKKPESNDSKNQGKRGIFDTSYGYGSGGFGHDYHHEPQVLSKTIIKEVAQPYPVEVEKHVPYPVKVEVPVDRPYPVHVPKPYPVHVDKPVPYEVKVKVPQPYTVYKHVPYEVKVPVDKPYTVHVPKPYTVYVEKRVPYEVTKHVPYPVKVPVDKPYTVHVPVEKHVPYTVEKPVPYPVKVPVDRPYPVTVEKHVPYPVDKPVPYTVEKPVPYHVKVPVKVEVP
ncbi:repetitive proline-rich cell wall protein 2-like, partial [Aphis craccivora]